MKDFSEICLFENERPHGITFLKPVYSPSSIEAMWLRVKGLGTQISDGP